jgi:hypothetical protein
MDVEGLLAIQRSSFQRATPAFLRGWPESDALTRDELAALLERPRYCVLASSRVDGRAHAAPVAFVVYEGAFWFATVAGLRLRNLAANPWAALVVMEREADVGEVGQPHITLTAEAAPASLPCELLAEG